MCTSDLKLYIENVFYFKNDFKPQKNGNWLDPCCEKLGTSVRIVEKEKMSVVRHDFEFL